MCLSGPTSARFMLKSKHPKTPNLYDGRLLCHGLAMNSLLVIDRKLAILLVKLMLDVTYNSTIHAT